MATPRAEQTDAERYGQKLHRRSAHQRDAGIHQTRRPGEDAEETGGKRQHRHALKRRPRCGIVFGVIEQPFGIHDGEPRPGDNGSQAEAHSNPVPHAALSRGGSNALKLGQICNDQTKENHSERRKNFAPGNG